MSTSSTSPPPPPSPALPPAPIESANIQFYLSGGINNGTPASAIGGAISQVTQGQIITNVSSNLYNLVTTTQAASGIAHQYRCFYVFNNANGETIRNAYIWFETLNSDPDITFRMGLDPGGKNSTPTALSDDHTTPPTGVTFSQPVSQLSALYMGRLDPGDSYPVWLDRTTAASAAQFYHDAPTVRVEGASQAVETNVPDFAICAVGNLSCSSVVAQQNVNNIAADLIGVPPLQRFIGLGDLGVSSTPACWFNMTAAVDSMTNIVIGDQEIYTSVVGSAQPALLNSYLNHYHLTQPYYSFNYGPIHFIILNTEILYTNPSPHYNFVVADLAAAAKNSNTFWTIACFHQPMYSAGGTGSVGTFVATSFATLYHQLFDSNSVDLVLTGHPYNYQRTKAILYNSPTTPTIAATGPNYTNPGAPIMVNVGTGGQQLDSTISLAGAPTFFEYVNNTDFGYLELKFTSSSGLCTGVFFNMANVALDTFTITKS